MTFTTYLKCFAPAHTHDIGYLFHHVLACFLRVLAQITTSIYMCELRFPAIKGPDRPGEVFSRGRGGCHVDAKGCGVFLGEVR